ncbi:MAG: hypothetical protein U9O83_04555, partial [Campylobacterota bacterium]|nr:hypothetical protein [Campylobacterota bacterium]
MKLYKISLVAVIALTLSTSAYATLKSEKTTLKDNMVVEYNTLPSSVDSINKAFSEGVFYARLRTNMFMFDWKKDNYPADPSGKLMDNRAMGIGGSFLYKTAPISGLSATAGLYTSQNPSGFNEDKDNVGYVKSGKDTFSRRDTSLTGRYGMSVLAQAYLQYDYSKTSFVAGRQLFESVFTKSNDTKMIPNTFDGFTASIKDIPKTTIQLAYLNKQKLRDHTVSHDVLAFNPNDKWS